MRNAISGNKTAFLAGFVVLCWGTNLFDYLSRTEGLIFNLSNSAFYGLLALRFVILLALPVVLGFRNLHSQRSGVDNFNEPGTSDQNLIENSTFQIFAFSSITANLICFFYLPGTFTGDARIFISIATETTLFSDLVAPVFALFFKTIYKLSGGKVGFFVMLQVYSLVYATVFLTHRLSMLIGNFTQTSEQKTPTLTKSTIAISLVLICNPLFLGFSTLMYVDAIFAATYLSACVLGIDIYLEKFKRPAWKVLLFLTMVILASLLRHNGVFLLPGFILIFALMIKTSKRIHPILSNLIPALTVAFVILVGVTGGARIAADEFVVEKHHNYYIAVPVYELLGAYDTFDHIKADLEWMSEYMQLESMAGRYGVRRHNAFIPIFWAGRDLGLVDMNSIYRDHDLILNKYLHILIDYPKELIEIKYKHFLYTMGSRPFWPSPFFSSYKDWTIQTPTQIMDRKKLGIQPNWISNSLLDRSRELARSSEISAMRFVLASPLVYTILLLPFMIIYLVLSKQPTKWGLLAVLLTAFGYLAGYMVATHGGFMKYPFPAFLVLQSTTLVVLYRCFTTATYHFRSSSVHQ